MTEFRRRARLFIAGKLQIKYIGLTLFFIFTSVFLTAYTVYTTTWIMFGEKLAAVYPQELLLDIVKSVNRVLLTRLAILTPFVILIGLVLSSRIAGPIFSIKRYLKKVSAGHYEGHLKFRKKDELHDVAETLNDVVDRMRREHDELSKYVDVQKREEVILRDTVEPRVWWKHV